MRLNLFIAKSGYASRRKADCLIKEGRVWVNRQRVLEPFLQINSGDKVEVEGKPLKLKDRIYILFNKPKGVTTTLSDKFARKNIIDYFSGKFRGIYPIGRLDKNSCGLLLLTNDGDFCYRLTHPKFAVEKEYLVELKGLLSSRDCQKCRRGLKLDGDYLKVKKIKVLNIREDRTLCEVVVSEGKKRHLRRLFGALGFSVTGLKRVRIGRLFLKGLKAGKYRLLDSEEIHSLFPFK